MARYNGPSARDKDRDFFLSLLGPLLQGAGLYANYRQGQQGLAEQRAGREQQGKQWQQQFDAQQDELARGLEPAFQMPQVLGGPASSQVMAALLGVPSIQGQGGTPSYGEIAAMTGMNNLGGITNEMAPWFVPMAIANRQNTERFTADRADRAEDLLRTDRDFNREVLESDRTYGLDAEKVDLLRRQLEQELMLGLLKAGGSRDSVSALDLRDPENLRKLSDHVVKDFAPGGDFMGFKMEGAGNRDTFDAVRRMLSGLSMYDFTTLNNPAVQDNLDRTMHTYLLSTLGAIDPASIQDPAEMEEYVSLLDQLGSLSTSIGGGRAEGRVRPILDQIEAMRASAAAPPAHEGPGMLDRALSPLSTLLGENMPMRALFSPVRALSDSYGRISDQLQGNARTPVPQDSTVAPGRQVIEWIAEKLAVPEVPDALPPVPQRGANSATSDYFAALETIARRNRPEGRMPPWAGRPSTPATTTSTPREISDPQMMLDSLQTMLGDSVSAAPQTVLGSLMGMFPNREPVPEGFGNPNALLPVLLRQLGLLQQSDSLSTMR